MTKFETRSGLNAAIIKVIGRIDGAASPEFDTEITNLSSEKHRIIIVDFSEVTYLSSAGLRVFISQQKKLNAIGGGLLLYNMNESVEEVFKLSGLIQIFKSIDNLDEYVGSGSSDAQELTSGNTFKDIQFFITSNKIENKGKVKLYGDINKIVNASYTEDDLIEIPSSELQFACGLAAIGDNYNDYKDLFGETASINYNFYTYPAVKNPNPDYMNNINKSSSFKGNFFYGFTFTGDYSKTIKIKSDEESYNLSQIFDLALEQSTRNMCGIVILGESAGIMGMNLKQVPIKEVSQGEEINIYSNELFYDWFDFPIEHSDYDSVVLASGLLCKNANDVPANLRNIFPGDNNNHLHGVLFEKDLISRNIEDFQKEIDRITLELEPKKVQHLLEDTRLKNIIIGIIEVEA